MILSPEKIIPSFISTLDPRSQSNFYLESWYPNETFNDRLIERKGTIIAVLNSYLPISLDNIAGSIFYMNLKSFGGLQAIQPAFVAQREVLPLWGRSVVELPFDRFYITWNPAGVFSSITNNTWNFSIDKSNTTPILLLIGNNIKFPSLNFINEEPFRITYSSSIPTTSSVATLTVGHGRIPKATSVTVDVDNAVNPINLKIQQLGLGLVSTLTEFDENISVFPYTKNFSIPEKGSILTRVLVDGGGAGETQVFNVQFNFRPRTF